MTTPSRISVYPSLAKGTKQARFVTFVSSPESTAECDSLIDLSFHVFDVEASEDREYFALSYVWGDSTSPKTVRVDGRDFQVTQNLHNALLALRRYFTRGSIENCLGYLWIDAICINQDDNEEKSHQVSMMSDIYSRAQQVVMWLGEASTESTDAVKHLGEWGRALADASLKFLPPEGEAEHDWISTAADIASLVVRNISASAALSPLIGNAQQDQLDHMRLKNIGNFFTRAYWKRSWILQEFVLAQDGLLLCGEESISLSLLLVGQMALTLVTQSSTVSIADHVTLLANFSLPHADIRHDYRRMASVREARDPKDFVGIDSDPLKAALHLTPKLMIGKQTPMKFDIASLLQSTALLDATDPRDKIYSLFGLLEDPSEIAAPDYSLDAWHVFADITTSIQACHKSLNVLTWAGTGFGRELGGISSTSTAGLPSWVPNFAELDSGARTVSTLEEKFGSSGSPKSTLVRSSDGKEIQVQGIFVDEVRACQTFREDHAMDRHIWAVAQFMHNNIGARDHRPSIVHWVLELYLNVACGGERSGLPAINEHNRVKFEEFLTTLMRQTLKEEGSAGLTRLFGALLGDGNASGGVMESLVGLMTGQRMSLHPEIMKALRIQYYTEVTPKFTAANMSFLVTNNHYTGFGPTVEFWQTQPALLQATH